MTVMLLWISLILINVHYEGDIKWAWFIMTIVIYVIAQIFSEHRE